MSRPILEPGPTHPITVEPHSGRVTVTAADRTIVDTTRALELKESVYPAVFYVPREDADMAALEPSEHRTYCPYKGEASHFSIRAGDELVEDAVWSYERPHDAVPQIAGYLAFYPKKVEITEH